MEAHNLNTQKNGKNSQLGLTPLPIPDISDFFYFQNYFKNAEY